MMGPAIKVPIIPESAPFSAEQRAWLNGYLAGLFARENFQTTTTTDDTKQLIPLTIFYGSQTGTAESLAKQTAKIASAKQFVATVVDMAEVAAEMLMNAKNILIITSTYGEGEPPDNAKDFWNMLNTENFPKLAEIPYAIFSLGDTNYEKFCQFGKDLDHRLEALGAKRVFERCDTDTDYDENFARWSTGALGALASISSEGGLSTSSVMPTPILEGTPAEPEEKYSKKKPFLARLKTNRKLSLAGSEKETRHFEITLDESISYEPGDALGVIPQNNPVLVAQVLAQFGINPETEVDAGGKMSLTRALTEICDLKNILTRLTNESKLGRATSAAELVDNLKKIQPRLYSISSSPKVHPHEVHLTVSVVRYELDGVAHEGLCSTFLADRIAEHALPIYVHKNSTFRLPIDMTKPIIMVGPGTGIAPFRAFLEERQITGATGKNMLFFGEQRSNCDFYYRDELEQMVKDGLLTLHTAFSRDQKEKIYVQQRMLENSRQIFELLEQGAYFYVCGDATKMAKDVDVALHKIVEVADDKSTDAAKEYIQKLRSSKRYLRDVY